MFLLKLWYPTFNLAMKSFNKVPMWVRLSYLPLQFWFEPFFEAIGDSLGRFLGVDEGSLRFHYMTFVYVFVEIDVKKTFLLKYV